MDCKDGEGEFLRRLENRKSDQLSVVKWRTFMDLHVLTAGDKMGHQYATVFQSGCWHTWDSNDVGLENGVEESIEAAKLAASLSVFEQGLIAI